MYACYTRSNMEADAVRYAFKEEVSLFGCIEGFIPWLLRQKLTGKDAEPWKWHLDVRACLAECRDYADCSLLIDLKLRQNKTSPSLYEVLDVWGYSSNGWTPILLRLNGLFVDANPSSADRSDFVLKESEIDGPIYEFLYLDGSVANGRLCGKWAPPPVSPTNAALLWPDSLRYFIQCIRSRTPEVFAE